VVLGVSVASAASAALAASVVLEAWAVWEVLAALARWDSSLGSTASWVPAKRALMTV
jgi:hypothetical protein